MSISFLRISPKPFPPPPLCYLHTAYTYLSPSGSHGCQGSDSSRLPHEKCRSGGRRWRTDFQVWPRARPGPDDAPEFGYSWAVGSRQVLLEQAGGSEAKKLGIGLGGLSPLLPLILSLTLLYHIIITVVWCNHDFNSLPPDCSKVAQPSGEYTEDMASYLLANWLADWLAGWLARL